ncbi:hypothetical protein [Paenibacillus sinopodophylli]|uniref:hypothetical protein n=1 Tax=Paenibacillus sinopodophylli TaxID=1837342 RepID=UPI00110CB112|nr:hypothetical protein [Paenibacillus sinopodophylli]
MLKSEVEVGVENVKITLKKKLDFYVGKVYETEDSEGTKVLGVVTEITMVKIENGMLTLDAKVQPLHIIE